MVEGGRILALKGPSPRPAVSSTAAAWRIDPMADVGHSEGASA
jgi:hypothetical protein